MYNNIYIVIILTQLNINGKKKDINILIYTIYLIILIRVYAFFLLSRAYNNIIYFNIYVFMDMKQC
jgi:hypothetical protein